MHNEQKTCIYRLAELSAAIKYEDLSKNTIEKIKLCIIDALECCVNPMTDGRALAALESIPTGCENAHSTLFGVGRKADAADAAYYNTVKACITSRNDTSMLAVCHPGNIIVAVVLALAEENGASGKRILEAVAAGYETMIRFGTLLDGKLHRSWRYTALFGPVGAAFAAAKLCGLSIDETASAASFACHSCCGVNEWALSGTGEDVFQNASGSRNGIFAMRLAKNGAKGCPSIIEGDSGIAAAFGVTDGYEILFQEYACGLLINQVIHKPITSCVFVQNPCQTAAQLLALHPSMALDEIDHIDVSVSASATKIYGTSENSHIETITHSIMSIPFGVASTLINGSASGLNFTPPFDPAVLSLMKKCFVYEEKAYMQADGLAAKVSIFFKDGKCIQHEKGTLTPLTDAEVKQLFHDTCEKRFGTKNADEALIRIGELDSADNCQDVTALLA